MSASSPFSGCARDSTLQPPGGAVGTNVIAVHVFVLKQVKLVYGLELEEVVVVLQEHGGRMAAFSFFAFMPELMGLDGSLV